jgi:curved DNA-binding protein CbpA
MNNSIIDFKNLKYNLYDILNISPDSDEKKIKKQFLKVIKKFHPDKNSELEQEIYYHLILSNQILLDKELRKLYDTHLFNKSNTFNELKLDFNKTISESSEYFPSKDNSVKTFKLLSDELNNKHNINNHTFADNSKISENFKNIQQSRNSYEFKINNDNIKNIDEFNNIFSDKKKEGKFTNMLVKYEGEPLELSAYVAGDQYTSIGDLNKLYVENSIQTDTYTSLNRAFMLQPIFEAVQNVNIEKKIKEYNDFTKKHSNIES